MTRFMTEIVLLLSMNLLCFTVMKITNKKQFKELTVQDNIFYPGREATAAKP